MIDTMLHTIILFESFAPHIGNGVNDMLLMFFVLHNFFYSQCSSSSASSHGDGVVSVLVVVMYAWAQKVGISPWYTHPILIERARQYGRMNKYFVSM